MHKRFLVLAALLVVAPFSLLAVACSDDDDGDTSAPAAGVTPAATRASGEAAAVEQTMRSAVDAYNKQNMAEFLSYWTDDGLMAEFDAARADLQAAGAEFFEGPPLMLQSIGNTSVSGNDATTEVELAFGIGVEKDKYSLVKEGGAWKIDGSEPQLASIPSGVTGVDVKLDEFSFTLDQNRLRGGNVAFNLDNVGDQDHEMVLIKSPASFGLTQLLQLQSEELPAGVEFVAAAGPIPSGEKGRIVFTEKLSGHYMVVCFLPDTESAEETPHFLKGMAVEFTITPQ
jgi:hypothetical protein